MITYSGDAATVWIASTLCWLLLFLYIPIAKVQAADTAELAAQSQMDEWIPNAAAFDNSSIVWPLPLVTRQNISNFPAATNSKMQFGRAFHDGPLDDGASFDFDSDNYKAVALPLNPNSPPAIPAPGSVHFHTLQKPASIGSGSASSSSSSLPFGLTTTNILHSYQQSGYSDINGENGYHYPAPQYLPPLPPAQYLPPPPAQYLPPPLSHNIEIVSEHHGPEHYYHYQQQHKHPFTENNTSHQLEFNSANRLFIQPGKCSNSVEVGRVRDVQVRTALRSGTDATKGICVLMLYTPNQLNKLAISLQAVRGTTNIIPTGTWLETNVKVYALQAGDIQPIFTK